MFVGKYLVSVIEGVWRAIKASSMLVIIVAGLNQVSCVTTQEDKPQNVPPEITAELPLNDALQAAIKFGGETTKSVYELIQKRQEEKLAGKLLRTALFDNVMKYEPHQLANATQLYILMPTPNAEDLFVRMINAGRPFARQLGWEIAVYLPSSAMAAKIEQELNRALQEGEEESVLLPQMARALITNRVENSYTFARQGLMLKGHEAYAEAMAILAPEKASNDFMTYLSFAPVEELRQLTLTTVNLMSCTRALQHIRDYLVPTSHPAFEYVFLYSVSRNNGLAELAQRVVEAYLPQNAEALAFTLSKQPVWVQMAFIENARRKMNTKLGLLLNELQKSTANAEVVNEIRSLY